MGRTAVRVTVAALAFLATPLSAEPTGRWFEGFGQGTFEYGIKNDSAGNDYFYIACAPGGASIHITVGGLSGETGSVTEVWVGSRKFALPIAGDGEFQTDFPANADIFRKLWTALRSGAAARVRLSTGQSTTFPLKNTAKVLPKQACATTYGQ